MDRYAVGFVLLSLGVPAQAAQQAKTPYDIALANFTGCLTNYVDTRSEVSSIDVVVSSAFAACASAETAVNAEMNAIAEEAGEPVPTNFKSDLRQQFTDALSKRLTSIQLNRQPAVLWKSLTSGMTPQEVVSALKAEGLRSQVRSNKDGSVYVEVHDRVDVAGLRATVETAFVDGRLFWVKLLSEPSFGQASTHFAAWTAALAGKYGQPHDTADAGIIRESEVAFTTQKSATFRSGPLIIDLLLNEVVPSSQLMARGLARPSSYLIAQYWRAVDAERYRKSESRKLDNERAKERERNSTNL